METKAILIIAQGAFQERLKNLIVEGNAIKKDFTPELNEADFFKLNKRFTEWNSFNKEYISRSFNNPDNEYHEKYSSAGSMNIDSMMAASGGANPDSFAFKKHFFISKISPKIDALESLLRISELIPSESNTHKTMKSGNQTPTPRIFISHSSKDSLVVGKIIRLIEAIGVKSDDIFCSSYEGYSIGLGENFLDRLKTELDSNVLVLFVLTKNFYNSPICLCEMGAAWIKTNEHIPILVPPFDFGDVKGVFPLTQGFKLNEPLKLNSFKLKLETIYSIAPHANASIWEQKRNELIQQINSLIEPAPANETGVVKKK